MLSHGSFQAIVSTTTLLETESRFYVVLKRGLTEAGESMSFSENCSGVVRGVDPQLH